MLDICARYVARNVFYVDRATTRRMKREGHCFTSFGKKEKKGCCCAAVLGGCPAAVVFLGVGKWCLVG